METLWVLGVISAVKTVSPAIPNIAWDLMKMQTMKRKEKRMNKKLGKALIFAAGAAVGAVISAFVTNRVVEKTYRDAADEEIFEANRIANDRIKKYKEEIKELQEKISRQKVTINTLADQVREGKGDGDLSDILSDDEDGEDDPRLRSAVKKVERKTEKTTYTRYTGRYGGTKVEEPEEEDTEFPFSEVDPEEEEDCVRENSPRLIDEDTFSNTAMSYSKEDLYFFLYDGKVVSEDGEWIENYQALTGPFDENKDAGDEIYIRNDELAVDYRIEFRAGYGEEAISMTDIWDEE